MSEWYNMQRHMQREKTWDTEILAYYLIFLLYYEIIFIITWLCNYLVKQIPNITSLLASYGWNASLNEDVLRMHLFLYVTFLSFVRWLSSLLTSKVLLL